MKFKSTPWRMTIAAIVVGGFLAACTKQTPSISMAEYPTRIIGSWQGSVGGVNEIMSIYSDDTFICQTYPAGFIGKRLSIGVAGTIRGTWKIDGNIITLRITGTENEPAKSRIVSSTIVAFTEAEIQFEAAHGESGKFFRVRMR